ncbi:thioredoxin family protein [Methanocalculus sp. MSAO_Arc2]|uniref:thioredoxin family protein n=1 Tax=Methanocalculus sp. MSAO_Arc2 TaxID=2293855 RepID=UPI003217DD44
MNYWNNPGELLEHPINEYRNMPMTTPQDESKQTEHAVIEIHHMAWEKNVEKAADPVVVMFYSPGCPHCTAMTPYFEEYATDLGEAIVFVRIDVTANPWIAERYSIMSTPTFAVFCTGRPVAQLVGAVYPALLRKMIEEGIANAQECAGQSTVIDYEITGYG